MNTGGPAFPSTHMHGREEGMTLRQYAAIKLRVPDSGIDWLDDMIRTSVRDDVAAKAMQAVPMPQSDLHDVQAGYDRIASHAYKMADAMLRQREKS